MFCILLSTLCFHSVDMPNNVRALIVQSRGDCYVYTGDSRDAIRLFAGGTYATYYPHLPSRITVSTDCNVIVGH
jgi:hypothetical protein